MLMSVQDRLRELRSLLNTAQNAVSRIDSLDGACNPFSSQAANATLHDMLKRATIQADKLTRYFSSQIKRKGTL
jgi:hypothetical protein